MALAFFDDYSKLHPENPAQPAQSTPAQPAPAQENPAQPAQVSTPDPSTASFDDIKAYIDATMESTIKTIKEEMSKFQPAAAAPVNAAVDNTSQANNNSNEGGE